MNHEEIERLHLVERYVTGRLSAGEAAGFEDHFVDCQRCLNRIEEAERFARTPSESRPSSVSAVRVSVASVRSSRERPVWQWLAAAAVLLAAGTALWQTAGAGQRQAELEASRADTQRWKQRYEEEAARRAQPAPAASGQPLIATTFALNLTRSAGSNSGPPANRIPVAPAAKWIALSLDRELESGYTGLRVTLTKSDGGELWRQEDAYPAPGASLTVTLPAALLSAGDYVLAIECKTAAGQFSSATRYRFRTYRP